MARELNQLVDAYLETTVADHPVTATFLGIHHVDGELGDYSPDAVAEKKRHTKSLLSELERLPLGDAPINTRIDAAVLRAQLKGDVFWHEELRYYEVQPAFPVRAALSGCHLLIARDFAPIAERAENLLSRVRQIPGFLATARRCLVDPPPVFTTVAIEAAKGGAAFLSRVVPRVAEEIPAIGDELMAASEKAALAFDSYAVDLSETLGAPHAAFPVGRDKYEWMLREMHLLTLDSDELLAMGQEVLRETLSRMTEVASEIDAARDWPEIVEDLKAIHPAAANVRAQYAVEMRRARDFVKSRGLVTIPKGERLDVIDTPEFARSVLPYAAYMPPGPFEKQQQGFLYVTPVDATLSPAEQETKLKGHGTHNIPIIALHEGYPGHHLQLVRANAVPSKVRRLCLNTVFIEGWALYCEEMMRDAGFYTDPRTRLFQLKGNLWRAARVIVDVKLQRREMTCEEAVDFLVNEVKLERDDATAEVKRYTSSPTQPSSYMIGKLAVLTMRRDYERKLGRDFNLAGFHDALLDVGSIQPRLAEAALGLTDDVPA